MTPAHPHLVQPHEARLQLVLLLPQEHAVAVLAPRDGCAVAGVRAVRADHADARHDLVVEQDLGRADAQSVGAHCVGTGASAGRAVLWVGDHRVEHFHADRLVHLWPRPCGIQRHLDCARLEHRAHVDVVLDVVRGALRVPLGDKAVNVRVDGVGGGREIHVDLHAVPKGVGVGAPLKSVQLAGEKGTHERRHGGEGRREGRLEADCLMFSASNNPPPKLQQCFNFSQRRFYSSIPYWRQ